MKLLFLYKLFEFVNSTFLLKYQTIPILKLLKNTITLKAPRDVWLASLQLKIDMTISMQ